jgi:DNA-binding NtrC family response regulator
VKAAKRLYAVCVSNLEHIFCVMGQHEAALQHFDGTIQVLCNSGRDIEAAANIDALCRILDVLQEVHQALTDRDFRATVWPADRGNLVLGDAVVTGHMMDIMTSAKRAAQTNVLVLITGESGTGKEIVARGVHSFSDRADGPFVPFNCAATPPHSLESQLFGHRRGAFTGAEADYLWFIRSARHATLFLDEIGKLGLELQPRLLRFLESGEISPLRETWSLIVDVRIVAATNRGLEQAVREGGFREDLFYRINVVRLALKPLRWRRDEIPLLVEQFIARAAKDADHRAHRTRDDQGGAARAPRQGRRGGEGVGDIA